MKPGLFLFILYLLFTGNMCPVKAQCDSTAEMTEVFAAFEIDDDLPFLQNTPLYLKANLDKASFAIIKKGTSANQFIRQIDLNGRIGFDTLTLTEKERKELDSMVELRQSAKWTKLNSLRCKMGRQIVLYKPSMDPTPGSRSTTYQLMEPIFLRNRTLAFMYYKREVPEGYSILALLIRQSGKWERWNKLNVSVAP